MYQPTVTDMTDYDAFLDPSSFMYQEACLGQFYTRRSNSRSGYRLFARVVHRGGPGNGSSSRMPCRESVYGFFSQFGSVMDCYLPESATNVAYLCFEDESTMEHVLALPEHLLCIEGVYVTLSRASPRPDYSMNNTDRVFVKNCPDSTTRTALRNYFSQFGLVTDVYIPKDKVTGEQKKFAFVTFGNVDSARAAISFGETHRLVYIDRISSMLTTAPLQVMPAEPRPLSDASLPKQIRNPWQGGAAEEDTFTTASSTVATNTPTSSGGLSVEAAASVLINALTQMAEPAPCGSPLSVCSSSEPSSCNTSELEEILAKLSSLSLMELDECRLRTSSVTPVIPPRGPSPAGSESEASSAALTQLIEETLSRQSSLGAASEVNIFEQFLNPNWESRE